VQRAAEKVPAAAKQLQQEQQQLMAQLQQQTATLQRTARRGSSRAAAAAADCCGLPRMLWVVLYQGHVQRVMRYPAHCAKQVDCYDYVSGMNQHGVWCASLGTSSLLLFFGRT
jgi:hypothetical protein